MRIFSLSTAEQGASMALFDGGQLACESYWAGPKSHSRRLLPMVEQMIVGQAGLRVEDIDGFIAARGPGSFTGLRIGISVIKGLAAAASKPCAGVSSLDGIALRFAWTPGPVCVMMDARRQEVYTAVYRFDRGRIIEKTDERVCAPELAIEQAGPNALFAGSGSKAYAPLIREKGGGIAVSHRRTRILSVPPPWPPLPWMTPGFLLVPILWFRPILENPMRRSIYLKNQYLDTVG